MRFPRPGPSNLRTSGVALVAVSDLSFGDPDASVSETATQPVYLGNEVPAFLGQDIQVALCYYLTPQGTGLLLQLTERSRVVLGGGVLVAVGRWHHPALHKKDAP